MDVVLPKYGVSMEEAFLVEWFKNEGDRVAEGDALAAVETDKVQTELESPVAGVLVKRVAELDEPIKVGEVVAVIQADGE